MFNNWKRKNRAVAIVVTMVLFTSGPAVQAEESVVTEKPATSGSATKKVGPQVIKLADEKLLLPVPGNWKTVKPRSRIIHHEFSISAAEDDETAGRMTIMPSGGGIEANIARWVGQFKTSDGKPLGDNAKKIEAKQMGKLKIHLVDLTGDFQDSLRGPFGPKVNRPGYRMLAAIIPLGDHPQGKGDGTWFVKFYGPQATVKAAEKEFAAMIEGMKYTP